MKPRVHLVPTTERGREWLAIGLLVMAVAWPFARAPRAGFGDDDLEYAVPFAHFVLGELAEGRWPTWNPATDGGLPLLAQQPWMGPIYPGLALFACLDDGWALAASYALHAALYALGIFLLLRRVGFGRASAWLAGAVLGLSSDVAVAWNRGYLHHLVSVSWIAWPILAFEAGRLGERPRRCAALGAGALGLAFLGGHTVSALQSALALAIWCATSVLQDLLGALRGAHGDDAGVRARAVRSFGIAVVIAVGALGLASVQLVPLRAVARAGTLPEQRAWKPWDLEMASPWRKAGYFLPGWETGRKGRDFVGLTPWMLAAVGVAARARRPRAGSGALGAPQAGAAAASAWDARRSWAPLVTATAFTLLSIGPHGPFFRWASTLVPPLGVISYPYFFAPGIHLGVAWLAAWGLDALRGGAGRWMSVAWGGGVVVAAACVGVARERIGADPLDQHGLVASVPHALPVVVAVGLAIALVAFRRLSAARGAWLLVALALGEIVGYGIRARADKPRYQSAAYFRTRDPLVRALAESRSLGRIWHVERTRPVAERLLRRNGGLLLGYEEINRSSRVGSRRYAEWTEPLGADLEWETALDASDRAERDPAQARALLIDDRRLAILDGLAVDRIVTDLDLGGVGASSFARTVSDATGRVHLYERVAGATQRARLAGATDGSASLVLREQRPGRTSLAVTSERGVTVSLAENPFAGWAATFADSTGVRRRLSVRAGAGAAPAIELDVPAGHHELEVAYSPSLLPALLSALTALVLVVCVVRRERGSGPWA